MKCKEEDKNINISDGEVSENVLITNQSQEDNKTFVNVSLKTCFFLFFSAYFATIFEY